MKTNNMQLPLWPVLPPGACCTGESDHPSAHEIPALKPFLLPSGSSPARPLVLVCPGGGYARRAPHEADPVACWLNSIGLHAAVCHYRVYPWLHPAPLWDAQRAVRLVRANARDWGVDPDRIGMLGFSAGGHLACSVANFGEDGDAASADPVDRQSSRINALVACYAVVSGGSHGHAGSFRNLLGDHPDPAAMNQLSLENSVTSANPPTFLWHTANDAGVPVENALLYAQALSRAKVPFGLHVYPDGRHGLGLAQDCTGSVRRWTLACEAWFRELNW